MEDKVKITNLVSSRVIISIPSMRLKRVWEKKGAVKTIPFDQLEEAMYEPGIETLFTEGYLGIEDMDVKKKLGLEPEDAVEPVNIIVLTDEQRKRYLTVLPISEFRAKVKELPHEQVVELANFAIENELVDFEKDAILQQMTGKDIVNTIKLNKDDEAGKEI